MNRDLFPDEDHPGLSLRSLEPSDRSRIQEIVVACGNFNPVEIATALELVDETLRKGEASGYIHVVLQNQGACPAVQGYACYGATPLTEGVFDLYWIAVDPAAQGGGLGRFLIRYVEEEVIRRNGRMILIETSSQKSYTPTNRFYKKNGYTQVARIKNFYRVGDDKLVYCKELKRSG